MVPTVAKMAHAHYSILVQHGSLGHFPCSPSPTRFVDIQNVPGLLERPADMRLDTTGSCSIQPVPLFTPYHYLGLASSCFYSRHHSCSYFPAPLSHGRAPETYSYPFLLERLYTSAYQNCVHCLGSCIGRYHVLL